MEYPSDVNCGWSIVAPIGKRVVLTFTDFDLEPSDDGCYDFVAIYQSPYPNQNKATFRLVDMIIYIDMIIYVFIFL